MTSPQCTIYNCLFSFPLPPSLPDIFVSQPSSGAQLCLGRQVLELCLAFCIVDSDGTGDALYCKPEIVVSWLQSDGEMDAACEPCTGIKRKPGRGFSQNALSVPNGLKKRVGFFWICGKTITVIAFAKGPYIGLQKDKDTLLIDMIRLLFLWWKEEFTHRL